MPRQRSQPTTLPLSEAPPGWRSRIIGHADVDPRELVANPRNWRTHPDHQRAALHGVLDEVGWVAEVLVNQRTGFVVDGHLRVASALEHGEMSVPVRYVDLDEGEERLVLASFDSIAALAGSDQTQLAALLEGLSSADAAVASLLRELAPPVPKVLNPDDADLTPPAEPITKPGDLWLLGEHRLLCGDATLATDIARVLDGHQPDVVITDPPYNVDYDYGDLTNDDRPMAEYMAWNRRWFELVKSVSASCVVLTCGITNLPHWIADIERTHRILAWVKENQNSRNYIGTTSGFNVWEPVLVYGKAKKCVARDSFSIPIGIQVEAADHPCPKSLKAWSWLVENFSDQDDTVLDVFLGAGTTLIAAEQLDRRCYAMDIEPAYVDVAVRRWERVTGRKAERLGAAVKANA